MPGAIKTSMLFPLLHHACATVRPTVLGAGMGALAAASGLYQPFFQRGGRAESRISHRTVARHTPRAVKLSEGSAPDAHYVKEWQHQFDTLQANGIPVHALGARYLAEGSFGDDVGELQRYLQSEGYLTQGDFNRGFFGSRTREAVRLWQADNDVPPTGGFGELSRMAYLHERATFGHELKWSFLSPSGTSARKTKALQRAKARREELRTQHREMTAQEGAPSGLNLQAMALVGAGITLLSAQAVWWFWLQSQRRQLGKLEAEIDRREMHEHWSTALGQAPPQSRAPLTEGTPREWAVPEEAPVAAPEPKQSYTMKFDPVRGAYTESISVSRTFQSGAGAYSEREYGDVTVWGNEPSTWRSSYQSPSKAAKQAFSPFGGYVQSPKEKPRQVVQKHNTWSDAYVPNVNLADITGPRTGALPAIDKTLSVREAQRMATEGVN